MKIARCIPLLILLASLIGCEATTFQKPPLAEVGCDPQLVGNWLTVPSPGTKEAPGEGELQVDTACSLVVITHDKQKIETSDPTQLHLGRDGTQGYFWVDSAWAFRFARTDLQPPAGDVTLLRYAVTGNELGLALTDDRAIAHHLIDGNLKGDVHKIDNTILNRIIGTLEPGQLRNQIGFKDYSTQFIRQSPKAAK